METTVSTRVTLELDRNMVLRFIKDFRGQVRIESHRGLALMTNGEAALCLGQADTFHNFAINDLREFKRLMQATGKREQVSIEFDAICDSTTSNSAVLHCSDLGDCNLGSKFINYGVNLLDLDAFQYEIPAATLADAKRSTQFCDLESTRYSLAAVCFDEGNIVTTNGRVLYNRPAECTGVTLVHADVVAWCAEYGCGCEVYTPTKRLEGEQVSRVLIAGALIVREIDGRYPDWRRVIPERKDEIELRIPRKLLADECTAVIKRAKAMKLDAARLEIVTNGNIVKVNGKQCGIITQDVFDLTIDAEYLLALMPPHAQTVRLTFAVDEKAAPAVTGPIVIVDAANPAAETMVAMPMARQ